MPEDSDGPLEIDVKPSGVDVESGEGMLADGAVFPVVAVLLSGAIARSEMPVRVKVLFSPDEARGHAMGLIIGAFLAEQQTKGDHQ